MKIFLFDHQLHPDRPLPFKLVQNLETTQVAAYFSLVGTVYQQTLPQHMYDACLQSLSA